MAFGVTEAIASISPSYPSISPKSSLNKPISSSVRFHISLSAPTPSLKFAVSTFPLLSSSRNPGFQLHSAVESVTVEEQVEESQKPDSRRKLFVLNLPWSYSVTDIKNLFGECGTVKEVTTIKHEGFTFVTMASGEEARAAIEKYDTYELDGRIIRVELSRRFKKPNRTVTDVGETRYKLYVSNLAWKVRPNHLREFFTSDFNPVSVKVVFGSPPGRSAGYGFVSFATKEEAESAISALDGKELLGRPIILKFSEKKDAAASESKEEESSEQQPQES